jgi:hypothetical protein
MEHDSVPQHTITDDYVYYYVVAQKEGSKVTKLVKLCHKDLLRHAYYTISNEGELLIYCLMVVWSKDESQNKDESKKQFANVSHMKLYPPFILNDQKITSHDLDQLGARQENDQFFNALLQKGVKIDVPQYFIDLFSGDDKTDEDNRISGDSLIALNESVIDIVLSGRDGMFASIVDIYKAYKTYKLSSIETPDSSSNPQKKKNSEDPKTILKKDIVQAIKPMFHEVQETEEIAGNIIALLHSETEGKDELLNWGKIIKVIRFLSFNCFFKDSAKFVETYQSVFKKRMISNVAKQNDVDGQGTITQ